MLLRLECSYPARQTARQPQGTLDKSSYTRNRLLAVDQVDSTTTSCLEEKGTSLEIFVRVVRYPN